MRTRSLRTIGAATLSSVFLFALVVNIILATAASSRRFSPQCGGSLAAAAPGTGSGTGGTVGPPIGGGGGGGGTLGEFVRSLTPPDPALLAALRGGVRALAAEECKEFKCFCSTADKKCYSTCGTLKSGTTCNCNDTTDTCNQEFGGECVGTCQAPAPAGAMWACLVTIAFLSIRRTMA